jgi:hypothetical protein
VIRQTCLSSHFGMIGQRLPTADEPVRFITAVSTPPGFGCKGLVSRVFGMPPPAICTTVPDTRPRVGEVSQKRCDSSTPNRLSSLATATGDCVRGRTCPCSTPDPEARLAGECAPRDTAGIAATCMHAAPERACGPAPRYHTLFSRPPLGPLQAYYWPTSRQLVGNHSDVDRIHIGVVA